MYNEILFALLLSALAGGILTFGWLVLQKILQFSPKTRGIYALLRSIMLVYTIPVVTVIVKVWEQIAGWSNGAGFLFLEKIQPVTRILFCIWLSVFLMLLVRAVLDSAQFSRNSKSRIRGVQWQQEILNTVCKELGVKKKIQLFQIYTQRSPYIMGVFRPAIYLPVRVYTEDELRMIFLHEVTHYRQKDVIWKPLFAVVRCAYWFFPPAIWAYHEMERWSEYCCDRTCCGIYSSESYFMTICEIAAEIRKQGSTSLAPMWIENRDDIYERAEYIVRVEKKRLHRRGLVRIFSVLVFAFCIVGAGAADYSALTLHSKLYFHYTRSTEETTVKETVPGQKEVTADQKLLDGSRMQIFADVPFTSGSIFLIDAWSLRAGTGGQTREFSCRAGAAVKVSVVAEPSDSRFWIGMIEPDQKISYVQGNDYLEHEFVIRETGKYRIFILNPEDTELYICGPARYKIKDER